MKHHILSAGDTRISQMGRFMQADAPEMLSLEMLGGTRAGLKDPSSILLSASAAKALFGDADPLDKMMRIDNQMDVKVTGVYKDIPHSSEFRNIKFLSSWDLMLSHNKWMADAVDEWGNSSFHDVCAVTAKYNF
jgi:putative ABC transport system permease protein